LVFPLVTSAADIEQIPSDLANQLSTQLSDKAGQLDGLKFKIDPQAEKGNGFHVPHKMGALIVPQKDLKESEELTAKFKMDPGASLAYLFVYHLVPVVDGKRLSADKFHSISLQTDDGANPTIHVLLLSVRQLADDDYRLYVFGKGANPLVDVKFAEGTGPGAEPVAVELKDPNEATREGKVVVTVFGKYQASFTAGYEE
jgi:hypothetical protein